VRSGLDEAAGSRGRIGGSGRKSMMEMGKPALILIWSGFETPLRFPLDVGFRLIFMKEGNHWKIANYI